MCDKGWNTEKKEKHCQIKILIWGTGRICTKIIFDIPSDCIIGYIDNNRQGTEFAGKKLYRPSDISDLEYDAIIVATVYGKAIYEQLCELNNIDLKKVIFAYGNVYLQDLNKDYAFISKICGEQYSDNIKNRYHLVREEKFISKPLSFNIWDYQETTGVQNDYTRIKTFELLVSEIDNRKIKGNVAELGVFRGEFAFYINAVFPDRKCYLFDTFEGFRENELTDDLEEINVQSVFREFFKETSVDIVMKNMIYPTSVEIKKGFFPDSLGSLEDNFCFVSLDADLEETLFQGLKYFYPRLNKGGYIMIHDYNVLEGARRSVDRYEKEYEIILAKFPIPDACGSIIITK